MDVGGSWPRNFASGPVLGKGINRVAAYLYLQRERSELVDCLQFLNVESGNERFAGQMDKQLVGGMMSWRRRKEKRGVKQRRRDGPGRAV